MLKKILTITFILLISVPAGQSESYYDNYEEFYDEQLEEGNRYCTPKLSIKEKLKNAFIGQPTGFTPQIQPSPYLNGNYGPSYMQRYYSGNTWNSHNIYNPTGQMRLYGKSF